MILLFRSHRLGRRLLALLLAIGAGLSGSPRIGWGEGSGLFQLQRSTGEKPQSKLFHAQGRDWAVLNDREGLAIFERDGDVWLRRTWIGGTGKADAKAEGTELLILVFGPDPVLHWLDFEPGQQRWVQRQGFPSQIPKIHASESLVLERDSTGRLWYTAEGDGNIHVYYSVTTQPLLWSSLVLETGVHDDDISSIVAFGPNRIGVFWSDQNRDAFGFRMHRDEDPPEVWSPKETVYSGTGHADDHVNLAADRSGRLFAVTKDDFNNLNVHRRGALGQWTTAERVVTGKANRGIIMVDGEERLATVLYANLDCCPSRIESRQSRLDALSFGKPRTFLSGPLALDDVTGTKQILESGRLLAMATASDSTVWWNCIDPEDPTEVVGTASATTTEVLLSWNAPSRGPADGYHVYRQDAGSTLQRLTSQPVAEPRFLDTMAPEEWLSYRVTAMFDGFESSFSLEERVDHRPPQAFSRLQFQVGPNPLRQGSLAQFHLSRDADVRLSLYDVRAQCLSTLVNRRMPAGDRSVMLSLLDAPNRWLPAGTYFLVLELGTHREARKVTVLH